MANNQQAFKIGMLRAFEIVDTMMLRKFEEFGNYLLVDADMSATFRSFTGNTLTSIAFGMYSFTG